MFVTTGAATVFGRICDQVKNVSERTRFSSRFVKKLIGDQLGDQQAASSSPEAALYVFSIAVQGSEAAPNFELTEMQTSVRECRGTRAVTS